MLKVNKQVAVYGTLRRGCGNDRLLQGAPCRGVFEVRNFRMYTEHASFPYVHYSPAGVIQVEVYDVKDEAMALSLDRLEGYPYHYQRKIVPYYDSCRNRSPSGTAWMYYVCDKPQSDDDYIKTGNWLDFLNYKGKTDVYRNSKTRK